MKTIVYRLLIISSFGIAVIYLVSCLSGIINPVRFWPLTFLALGFPILAILMLVLAIGWLFHNKWISLLFIVFFAAGFKNLSNVFAFNTGNYNVEKSKQSLRIIIWNVWYFDNNTKHAEHPDSIRRRMINFLKQQNADVLLLQEYVEYHFKSIYSNTQMLRDSLGYKYYYTSRDVILYMSYGPVEYGSAIFSKYPLTDTVKLNYDGLALTEGAISGSIQFNNKKIRLITTHLVSMNLNKGPLARNDAAFKKYDSAFIYGSSKFTKLKFYDQLHSRQAIELKNFAVSFKEPIVISGDFNSVPTSYTYNTIKRGLQDAFLTKGFGLGRTYASLSPTLRIDYIFADKSLKVSQFFCPPLNLSDHFPIITDVDW